MLPEDAARDAHRLLRAVLGEFVEGEATLDADALHRGAIRAYGASGSCSRLGAQVTPEPGDVAAARMAGQLAATLARLEVTADWPALARQLLALVLRRGPRRRRGARPRRAR